jgi:hypothetical protein
MLLLTAHSNQPLHLIEQHVNLSEWTLDYQKTLSQHHKERIIMAKAERGKKAERGSVLQGNGEGMWRPQGWDQKGKGSKSNAEKSQNVWGDKQPL